MLLGGGLGMVTMVWLGVCVACLFVLLVFWHRLGSQRELTFDRGMPSLTCSIDFRYFGKDGEAFYSVMQGNSISL